jgi:CheY-like chemotaxis protein
VRGGRVLWIDDKPHRIAGERRLLRSLGIDVTPAISSDEALRILEHDNDFDLVVSDVQRTGKSHEVVGGEPIHEGVNFVVWLRTTYHDALVRSLPVVFYAAYDNERLVKFTRSARDLAPEAALSHSVVTLVPLVVAQLAEARTAPIRAPGTKEPTRLEGDA